MVVTATSILSTSPRFISFMEVKNVSMVARALFNVSGTGLVSCILTSTDFVSSSAKP